jgi:hypothetical protein
VIKKKKGICVKCGEERYIFAKSLCAYHYKQSQVTKQQIKRASKRLNKHSNTPVEPPKSKSRPYIPLRTKKRSEQERDYHVICGILDKELKEQGRWHCWFCHEKFERLDMKVDHHHCMNRDGERLTEKKYLRVAHRSCHDDYHHQSVHKIPWYKDWLSRIETELPELYEKEKLKLEK